MTAPLVVVGDALLDVDVLGVARRLCPDAPVPVLDDIEEHARPGGAALAALMAARDGHDVVLVTAIGDDEAGSRLRQLLTGLRVICVPYDGPTPVKSRIRSGGQSLVRLDRGTAVGRFGDVGAAATTALGAAGTVLVSDYGRGVTGLPGLRDGIAALPNSVPVVWDPHPRGADPVPGTHLVTPNSAEAASWAQRHGVALPSGPSAASGLGAVLAHASALVRAWQARAVAVTLGSRGAVLTYGDGAPAVSPAPAVHCVDPCGAGDRFAVTAAIELGRGRLPTEAVDAAVRAASAYVSAGGPVAFSDHESSQPTQLTGPLTASTPGDAAAVVRRVHAAGGVVVAAGGCFDLLHAGHIATLQGARRLGDCLVVCVNSDASVRRLKGPSRPLVSQQDRTHVLSALECVDAVAVFDEDTPADVLERLRPDIWVKGGDYAGVDVPEASVLSRWAGQVVTLSYLAGRSTSQLAATAAGSSTDQPFHRTEERTT